MNAQLQFDPDLHRYSVNGQGWPSVTQILEPLQILDGIPKDVLAAAAQFGSHVHLACHLHDLGRLDESDLDEPLRPYLEAWKKFLRDTGAVVFESERRVCHPSLKVAGTLDKVIRMPRKNERFVLDIKSGSTIPWTVGMQTAAYREMLWMDGGGIEELPYPSKTRFCCQLKPDATYKLDTLTDQRSDWNDFVSCVNVHRLRLRHGRAA